MDNKVNDFILDQGLAADCFVLGKLKFGVVLLMNNSLVPWFILVPRTNIKEICELNQDQQTEILKEINLISNFVKKAYLNISKLNIAAIGNIVSQMHIHVVGRNQSDYCWPNVVWGNKEKKPYAESAVAEIMNQISAYLGNEFERKEQ